MIAATESRHGIATGLPVSNTTMVFGLAAATASITASWPHGSDRSGMSNPSASTRIPNTIAMSARRATCAASAGDSPGSNSMAALGSSARSSSSGDDGCR